MAKHHLVHHVEIHPHYSEDGEPQGHHVHTQYLDGKIGKSGPHELGKAMQHAHSILTGHEETYEAEMKEQSHGKNAEEPDADSGIPGVPSHMARGMMSKGGYTKGGY